MVSLNLCQSVRPRLRPETFDILVVGKCNCVWVIYIHISTIEMNYFLEYFPYIGCHKLGVVLLDHKIPGTKLKELIHSI